MNKYLITIDNNFKDNEKILNHVINRNPIDDICDEMIVTIKSEPKIITLMIKALNYYKDYLLRGDLDANVFFFILENKAPVREVRTLSYMILDSHNDNDIHH